MSDQEPSTYRPFVFSVVEDDGENVTIEISEKDYEADLAAGIDEEDTELRERGFPGPDLPHDASSKI